MQDFMVNMALPGTIGLVLVAAGLALLFAILQMFISPKNAVKTIVSIAILAAVLFGLYAFASDEKLGVFQTAKYDDVTPFVMKYTTTGILSAMVMIAIAFAAWILLEVINLFK